MEEYKREIVETIIFFIGLVVLKLVVRYAVNNATKSFSFDKIRKKISVKIINLFTFILVFVAVTGIWGIKKSDLLVFVSSVLTVLGIAFVAQWSILSNITSGLILFFNHPMKLGDRIRVSEKDLLAEGVVQDISFFFITIKDDAGVETIIPNTVVLQKVVSIHKK